MRLLIAPIVAVLLLSACTSESSDDDAAPSAAPTTSEPPALTPAQELVEPLMDAEAVDLRAAEVPKAPAGAPAEAWEQSVESALSFAEASIDERSWTEEPGRAPVARVIAGVAQPFRGSMTDADDNTDGSAYGAYFAGMFPADAQPDEATVVDARWGTHAKDQNGTLVSMPVLQWTTLYVVDDAPIVVQRQIGTGRTSMSDPFVWAWFVTGDFGGADRCQLFTDGLLRPAESPDLEILGDVVEAVGEEVDVELDTSTIAEDRRKACAEQGGSDA